MPSCRRPKRKQGKHETCRACYQALTRLYKKPLAELAEYLWRTKTYHDRALMVGRRRGK